jgi:hypothetical protein
VYRKFNDFERGREAEGFAIEEDGRKTENFEEVGDVEWGEFEWGDGKREPRRDRLCECTAIGAEQ